MQENEQELISEIGDNEIPRVKTLTPAEAGEIIRKNPEYIRALLKQGKVHWGTAVQGETGQWSFNIIKSKFFKYAGLIDEDDTQQEILKTLKEIKEAIVE